MLCLETGLLSSLGAAADAFSQECRGLVDELEGIIGECFFARCCGGRLRRRFSGSGCLGCRFLGCDFFFVVAI